MSRSLVSQMTLHKLEVFCVVGELESISRAAERIGIAQPVVTAHVRSLEEKLGVRLISHLGRGITLTEAGVRTLRWANEIVTRTRELERELVDTAEGSNGSVVIAASMTVGTYVLPDLLARFRRIYTNGEVTLHISNPRAATDAVRSGTCDFALSILDPRHAMDGLTVERLFEEQLVLVAHPDFDTDGFDGNPALISALPFITSPRNQVRHELENDALKAYGIQRDHIVLELGHPEAMKQAVRSNAGVAFVLESSIKDDIARGILKRVPTGRLNLPIPMFLVFRKGKVFSSFQQALVQRVRELSDEETPH